MRPQLLGLVIYPGILRLPIPRSDPPRDILFSDHGGLLSPDEQRDITPGLTDLAEARDQDPPDVLGLRLYWPRPSFFPDLEGQVLLCPPLDSQLGRITDLHPPAPF